MKNVYIYYDMNKYSKLITILVLKIQSHANIVHLPLFKSILYFWYKFLLIGLFNSYNPVSNTSLFLFNPPILTLLFVRWVEFVFPMQLLWEFFSFFYCTCLKYLPINFFDLLILMLISMRVSVWTTDSFLIFSRILSFILWYYDEVLLIPSMMFWNSDLQLFIYCIRRFECYLNKFLSFDFLFSTCD